MNATLIALEKSSIKNLVKASAAFATLNGVHDVFTIKMAKKEAVEAIRASAGQLLVNLTDDNIAYVEINYDFDTMAAEVEDEAPADNSEANVRAFPEDADEDADETGEVPNIDVDEVATSIDITELNEYF